MNDEEQKQVTEVFNEAYHKVNGGKERKQLLRIVSVPKFIASEEGMELNEGYEFEVDGALPEVADGIAKFAKELEPNGFGENAGGYFISLITEYYRKLLEQ